MPSNFKKLVKARIAKTGENYESAARFVRAQVTAPKPIEATDSRAFKGQEAYYDAARVWFPLRRDGLWLEELDWTRNLRGLRSRKGGIGALAALKAVFTPEWSQAQSGVKALHPIVYDSITVGGRHRLLEIGAMLSTSKASRRVRDRLLLGAEYYGVCAELHVALLLSATGAQFEAEPVKDGPGPDGLAHWDNGSLAVEVKRPNESARAKVMLQIELDFFDEFSKSVSEPPLKVDTGVWLTLHVNANAWPKTVTGAFDSARIRGLARDVAGTARARLEPSTSSMHFAAGPGVDVNVQTGAGDEPRAHLGMHSYSADAEHHVQRLFQIVQDAAHQLRAVKGEPGLVVLDADADVGILNHLQEIESMLVEEWARGLAGVAVVTKTCTVDERLQELRLDTIVRIVPGPMSGALEHTLLPGLRICKQGHYHVDALLRPTDRCGAP